MILCILLISSNSYSFPSTCVGSDHGIPQIALESLDMNHLIVVKKFSIEDIPVASDYALHLSFHENSNRTVYATDDGQFFVKIWQKNYFHRDQFVRAYQIHFYDSIAHLSAIIIDADGECRGYITPAMVDRDYHRKEWDSYGFVLQKNNIGVKIFASYEYQPSLYKRLFDCLIEKTKITGLVMLDFCPNNCAIDPHTGDLYLIDLEDVDSIAQLQKRVTDIYVYNPLDYLEKIFHFAILAP